MKDYDKTWEIIESMARTKLIMNDHKGRIEDVSPGRLLTFAAQEIEELRHAIANDRYMDVIEEAADVLNFVMAAAHQQIYRYRNKHGNPRSNETADHQALDHSSYVSPTVSSRPQLGSGSDSPRDRQENESTPGSG